MKGITFQDELSRTAINLPGAALRFAKEIAYPDLPVEAYLERLDRLTEAARLALGESATVRERADALADFLFDQQGFQGNAADYQDPRNSYLNQVLDRRLGIPISLSVIYLSVAERLRLPAFGVGLPGHFIVGVADPAGMLYLDPFHAGQRLSVQDCENLVLATSGSRAFRREWLDPSPTREILARMLTNLRNVYLGQENWLSVAAVVERLRMIRPEQADYARDLGVFYQQSGKLPQAIECYLEYLRGAPEAADRDRIWQNMQDAVLRLARRN